VQLTWKVVSNQCNKSSSHLLILTKIQNLGCLLLQE
jgi:hypothetical protein